MPSISLTSLALVFCGGGLGSVARYALSLWGSTQMKNLATEEPPGNTSLVVTSFVHILAVMPLPTLLVNVLGSLMIGAVVQLASDVPSSQTATVISPKVRLLLAVGFCGGFTTFSTFSLEALSLLQTGRFGAAVLYAAMSVMLCIAGTAIGIASTYWLLKQL
jgi:CrcB protein